jgi:ATP-dependent DNA helicase RecG
MSGTSEQTYLEGLVAEFLKLPAETSWLEFKRNNHTPEDIGQYISALGNMAALHGKANGYVLWGIDDATRDVVGTHFLPSREKQGNEDLLNWLTRLLSPKVHFRFHEFRYVEQPLVLLEVSSAPGRPIQFQNIEYIRVGSHRQKLKDHPQIEQELWRVFDVTPFEGTITIEHVAAETVLKLLDYPSYFDLLSLPLPSNRDGIFQSLEAERMIAADGSGHWNITSLGGILFAKDLASFPKLARKAVRVIVYKGKDRIDSEREYEVSSGYAVGFDKCLQAIDNFVPHNESIGKAFRKDIPMYPALAIRELVANAIIHQDFFISGCGPMVEIFSDRIEITNPGKPLVDIQRFLDTPPRSRNEQLAAFMRRIRVCEERGSGVDKVVSQMERFLLPAPLIETYDESTRITLFSYRPLKDLDRADRSRSCYFHACLRYVQRDMMTNSSLRERFDIAESNASMVSRIIRETMEDGLVKPADPDQGKKYAKYLPFWA